MRNADRTGERPLNSPRYKQFFVFAICLLLTYETCNADELARFQGKWEMKGKNAGNEIRVVKTIEGNRETVEVFSNGVLTQKHYVEFELKSFGPVNVFLWSNGRITQGPKTGKRLPDGRFIYKIDAKTLVGVHGMLDGDKTAVVREVYKRIGKPTQPPAT